MYYAAYGSNLHPLRLSERTPSAECLGSARVSGYTLHFDKRGGDGSGKCRLAAGDGDIWVAVFALSGDDGDRLDEFEGAGYERGNIEVPDFGRCFTYVAQDAFVDAGLEPWDWYRDLVLAGCRRHGFPEAYCRAVAGVRCRRDGDAARAARHAELIARIDAAGAAARDR